MALIANIKAYKIRGHIILYCEGKPRMVLINGEWLLPLWQQDRQQILQ